MSGGAVLNESGEIIGIHGQGETDYELSKEAEIAVKTGTNQGIPSSRFKVSNKPVSSASNTDKSPDDGFISRFGKWISKLPSFNFKSSNESLDIIEIKSTYLKPSSASDHLAIANSLKSQYYEAWPDIKKQAGSGASRWNKMGDDLILNARLSNAFKESSEAYLLEAIGYGLKEFLFNDGTIEQYNEVVRPLIQKKSLAITKSLEIDPNNVEALLLKAQDASVLSREKYSAYSKVLEIDPMNAEALAMRGRAGGLDALSDARAFYKQLFEDDVRNDFLLRQAINRYELAIKDLKKLDSSGLLEEWLEPDTYPRFLLDLARLYRFSDRTMSHYFSVEWLLKRACQSPKFQRVDECQAFAYD